GPFQGTPCQTAGPAASWSRPSTASTLPEPNPVEDARSQPLPEPDTHEDPSLDLDALEAHVAGPAPDLDQVVAYVRRAAPRDASRAQRHLRKLARAQPNALAYPYALALLGRERGHPAQTTFWAIEVFRRDPDHAPTLALLDDAAVLLARAEAAA